MTDFVAMTEENSRIVDTVRRIITGYGRERFVARARSGEGIDDLWGTLVDAGLIGALVPTDHGGSGLGVETMSLMMEELAAEGCPLPAMVLLTVSISILAQHGTLTQKAEWLTRIADGSAKLSFAITEPDAGTNSHAIRTSAVRDGDDWIIDGTKYYITAIDEAAAFIVLAKTGDDPATGRGKLTMFLVAPDSRGLSFAPIETSLTTHERQFTVFFDKVRVPASAMIGAEGSGLKAAFAGLNPERIVVAGMCNGLSRYALRAAAAYANERRVWHTTIGAHQAIAHPLAQAYAQLKLAQLATQRAAQIYDSGGDAGESSNIAKFIAADSAVLALDRAIQTHGGNGVSLDYGLTDLWFLTRLQQIAPVSREMILNYLAQHGLGLEKSY